MVIVYNVASWCRISGFWLRYRFTEPVLISLSIRVEEIEPKMIYCDIFQLLE